MQIENLQQFNYTYKKVQMTVTINIYTKAIYSNLCKITSLFLCLVVNLLCLLHKGDKIVTVTNRTPESSSGIYITTS